MTHRVYKYELMLGSNIIALPLGAKALSVHVQHNRLCLWALVDCSPEVETEGRVFEVYGTGAPIQDHEKLTHLGTCPAEGGRYIWHVFERTISKH